MENQNNQTEPTSTIPPSTPANPESTTVQSSTSPDANVKADESKIETPPATKPDVAVTAEPQASPESPTPANNQNGRRVLLVEDDQFLRDLLERKLKTEGFNVQTAIEGESALAKVKEFKPEIVLLDIILPGVDGFSILEQIKADPSVSNIPVVMLSNLGQKDDVDKGMKLGAVGYLVKAHFTPSDIVAKVNEILK